MQPTACEFCKKPLVASEVLYTADARTACAACAVTAVPDPYSAGAPLLASLPEKEFEFGVAENEVFSGVSLWMGIVGIASFIFGLLTAISGAFVLISTEAKLDGLLKVGQGLVLLLVGGWLWGASRSFRQIAVTEGNDVMLLMHAMRRLRSVYTLQGVLMIIGCVLVVVMLVVLVGGSKLK